MTSPWFVRPRVRERARIRLVCFAYAGVGASIFARWPDLLGDDIELWAVQLPGREARLREPARTDLAGLARDVATELRARIAPPYAFFGHSMGAVLAFETAHVLAELGAELPRHLFLSSRRPPHVPDPAPPLRLLADDAFIAEIMRRYGGIPAPVLEDAEMLALLLPALRADVAALEAHVTALRAPLAVPISVFGGIADANAPLRELEAWRVTTSRAFRVHQLPGGHFYLADQRSALVAEVRATLAAVAGLAGGDDSVAAESREAVL